MAVRERTVTVDKAIEICLQHFVVTDIAPRIISAEEVTLPNRDMDTQYTVYPVSGVRPDTTTTTEVFVTLLKKLC
jgi:hypothetical protein